MSVQESLLQKQQKKNCAVMLTAAVVKKIGIDFDTHSFFVYRQNVRKAEQFGYVIDQKTKHGWHLKIYLPEGQRVTMKRAFEIRYVCGDDKHRLLRDVLKTIDGIATVDVLFDYKRIRHRAITWGYKKA